MKGAGNNWREEIPPIQATSTQLDHLFRAIEKYKTTREAVQGIFLSNIFEKTVEVKSNNILELELIYPEGGPIKTQIFKGIVSGFDGKITLRISE